MEIGEYFNSVDDDLKKFSATSCGVVDHVFEQEIKWFFPDNVHRGYLGLGLGQAFLLWKKWSTVLNFMTIYPSDFYTFILENNSIMRSRLLQLLCRVKPTENGCPKACTYRILVLSVVHGLPGADIFCPAQERRLFTLEREEIGGKNGKAKK